MDSLYSILGEFSPFKTVMVGVDVTRRLRQNWSSVMGKLGDQIRFESFLNGQLTCATANMMWVNEIKFHQAMILSNCEKVLGKRWVTSIRIVHESSAKFSASKRGPKKARPTGHDSSNSATDGLYDKIVADVAYKKSQGYQLCSQCQSILVKPSQTVCIYCRAGRVD